MVNTHPTVTDPLVRQVLLCDLFDRPPNYRATASSLPGHLIQLTVEGETEHIVEGRRYHIGPRSLLWYNEVEQVTIRTGPGRWRFYTCNFIAEGIEAPPFDQRMKRVGASVERGFAQLLEVWRAVDRTPVERHLVVHAAMAALMAEILRDFAHVSSQAVEMAVPARLWWDVEAKLRANISRWINLPQLAEWSGRSPATLARACHAAVGMPPMRRLKHIRMNLAKGLVYRSSFSVKEIAARLGYGRMHEFSRDYRKQFGVSPRQDRAMHLAVSGEV